MTLFRDTDTRFRHLDVKVGLFVLLGVLAVSALVLLLAWQQGYFATRTELRLEAPTGIDLRPGMAVKLSGFKIGDVSSVELNEHARVDVVLRIEDRYMPWIKADSQASIAREGLIGDSYLEVRSGNPELQSLRAGDTLLFEPSPALADIAADLRTRTLPVIDGTTRLLGYLNDPQGDFRGSMRELRYLVAELRQTRRQLDTVLAGVDRLAREDVKRTLATVEREVTDLSTRTDASLAKLDEATREAAEAADAAARAIDTASPRLNRVLDNTDAAVRDARKLMDGAGKRWPFKGGAVPVEITSPAPPAP